MVKKSKYMLREMDVVEARCIHPGTIREIVRWINDQDGSAWVEDHPDELYIRLYVQDDCIPRRADIGEWIVKNDDSFIILDNNAFRAKYVHAEFMQKTILRGADAMLEQTHILGNEIDAARLRELANLKEEE